MKLTIVLMLTTLLQVGAVTYAQKITINKKDVSLKEVFEAIQKQSSYTVVYDSKMIRSTKPVTLSFKDASLEDVLDKSLKDQSLTYTINLNTIVIRKQAAQPQTVQQAIRVTGKVTDNSNNPLGGVSIVIKGTHNGVVSDINGKYSISVPDQSSILVFSFIGFETQQKPVGNNTVIDVVLKEQVSTLNAVIVIGYGTQRESDITSAISTVSTKDISSRPVISPAEELIGKAPGVQVVTPSGTPGGDLSIRIRGIGSPNGAEPLYVVDGVLANDIKGLDPNSIESISILKDASAAGIYGAAGSTNGVVMITTKQGTKGKTRVDVSVYSGMQQITKKIPVLNNQQWLGLETEILGTAPVIPSYYNLNTTNNNWQDIIYHNAMQTSANVGLSGGSENGTYYFGVSSLQQDGIMVGSNFDRYSVKMSLDQNFNNWLKLGTNISYNRSNQRTVPQNASSANGGAVISALVTPEYIPVTMPAGSPNPGVYGYSTSYSGDNPLSDIYGNTNNTIANNLLGDVYTEIKLPFGIKYRSQFNVIMENSKYDYFLDPYKSLYGMTTGGSASDYYSETFRWAWDNTLSYAKTFGLHSLNIVAGTSALDEKISLSSGSGTGFASSSVQTLNGASANFNASTSQYEWSTNSYFGRVMYSYNDKYLLNATLRSDGSSRVGINNKWGAFPAVSGGWKVSNEKFMENVNWMQDLKIRAGWGETGNLPPYTMLYPSYTLLSPGSSYAYSAGTAQPGVAPGNQLGNPNLKWESAQQTNVGFDASFLNHRLTVSADYYYKKVTNMIFTEQLPLTTGGRFTAANLPGFDINKGFEFNIGASIVKQKDVEWDVNGNMSFNNNIMQGLSNDVSFQTGGVTVGGSKAPLYTEIIKNGYSLGTFWGYQALGVNPATGNMAYGSSLTNLGSALPKFTYGLSTNVRYKAFSLSLLFDGVYGNKIYDETRMETESLSGYANESAAVLSRWENSGSVTSIPTAIGNGTTNSAAAALLQDQIASNYVEDGSFFRLRNATLSYKFNPELLKHIGIEGLRLFVTGQNLFIVTKYKGYYPELNGFGSGTNNQAVNAGNGGASLMALGIDNGTYPAAKIYTIGVNIQL